MSILQIPWVRWCIVVSILLGVVNVVTRPSTAAQTPTVDLAALIRYRETNIAAEIASGAPQPLPQPIPQPVQPTDNPRFPTSQPTTIPERSVATGVIAELNPTPIKDPEHVVRGFASYVEGMDISSAEAFRETLHTAFVTKQPTFRIRFTGKSAEYEQLRRYLESLANPDLEHYPLEGVSHSYYTLRYEIAPATKEISAAITYEPIIDATRFVAQREQEIIDRVVQAGMSEAETVKAIHDWVVLNLADDASLTRFYAYDALHDGTAVCNGYALLTYDLLERAGIRAYVVTGTVHESLSPGVPRENRGHAWNIVRVDGQWYQLDVTWDDPVPDEPGRLHYTFFLVDEKTIAESRDFNQSVGGDLRPITPALYTEERE